MALATTVFAAMVGLAPPADADAQCAPTVMINNTEAYEGDDLKFAVTMSAGPGCDLIGRVHYETIDTVPFGGVDADVPADYSSKTGALQWSGDDPATQFIIIHANGDLTAEVAEELAVRLFTRVGGTAITDGWGVGGIRNSTPICVAATSCRIGIDRVEPARTPLMVGYRTADGTARAGEDFVGVSGGEVTIPAEITLAEFDVRILPNVAGETDELFEIRLTEVAPGTFHTDRIEVLIPAHGRA
jgi:hypothetical protein